jgi:hypothetical protein
MKRLSGALVGAGILTLIPAGAAAWGAAVNPWFLDAPVSYLGVVFLPVALLGGLLGALVGRGAPTLGGGLLSASVAVILLAAARPTPEPVSPRLLIYGIDGAGWSMLDSVETPALDRLSEQGSRAILHSREPMFSPLLWTTMASGKVPDEHGIHGFRTQADHCTAARLWDIAGAAGQSFGIYKWLVTWPVYTPPAGGFIVPAWLAPQPDTFPAELSFIKEIELSRRLKRKQVAGTRSSTRLVLAGIPQGFRFSTLLAAASWSLRERIGHPNDLERAWRLQLLRVWMDRDVFIAALHRHRPDFITFTTYATDALGHTHWDLMTDCAPAGCPPWSQAVPDAYRQADAVLGEILDNVTDDTAVMVVSDHGFRSRSADDAGRYFSPLTERLRDRIIAEVGPVDVARLGHKITISLLAEDFAAQKQALETWLAALTQASTGEPFYRWEDLPDTDRAVGLTLRDELLEDEQLVSDTVGGEPVTDYVKRTEGYAGEHDYDGVILVRGAGVAGGLQVEPVELLDVAPTALTLLGLPAAEDMPGEVVFGTPLPRVPTHAAALPVFEAGGSAEEYNEEQLRALGYIE